MNPTLRHASEALLYRLVGAYGNPKTERPCMNLSNTLVMARCAGRFLARLWDRADVVDTAGRYDQPVTRDELLAHCLLKPGAWQDEPWEGDTVVKVGPKIFAFLGSGDGAATHGGVGVKCAANRDAADEWLRLYPDDASVMPYIGRSGWNTLRFGGAIPDDEVLDAVDESYRMVVAKLPKKDRPA
jgi:predicted DNA-binding protein (MmcQ/YjbR family)